MLLGPVHKRTAFSSSIPFQRWLQMTPTQNHSNLLGQTLGPGIGSKFLNREALVV